MTPNDAVLVSAEGAVARIRFNRPDRLNAISRDIADGFLAATQQVLARQETKVVVIEAAGRAFVAGGDLAYLREAHDAGVAARHLIDPMHDALAMLADAAPVVIASIKGAVAGAGMSVALGCDLVVAADDATFNFAYARVGASPDCGGSWALPRLVGLRKALEIALLCETVDAASALDMGLVTRVVPRAALEDETTSLAQRLATGPATAQGNIKRLIRTGLDRDLPSQLAEEARSFVECARTPDFAEALDAFFTRRKPAFAGR